MCSFSAKGPWCVLINGVPYGAYTEPQARRIQAAHLIEKPGQPIEIFPMSKLENAPAGYPDSVVAGHGG